MGTPSHRPRAILKDSLCSSGPKEGTGRAPSHAPDSEEENVWESGIMLAFRGDYKTLTVGKSADCTIPLKKSRYSNRAVRNSNRPVNDYYLL